MVRFQVDGPVRDVIVCHCQACREATGAAWPASAARRGDLTIEDEAALSWEMARVSQHGASRGRCRGCGMTVFWDAPGRETVSFAAATLSGDGPDLAVAAHIWVPAEERAALLELGLPVVEAGLPASVVVAWREDETPAGEEGRRI